MSKNFLTAEWRKLAIANFCVDPAILLPYLPYKTELDTWNGKCFVSLVGFRFLNTKLKGFSIPFHKNFEEVNLRFYVRFRNTSGWRRGVTFIKEIVPRHALTLVANTVYKENYITLPMKYKWELAGPILSVEYSWKHQKRWHNFSVAADATAMEILPGSEEEFITEHYWGYTALNPTSTSQYQVQHPRWQVYKVRDHKIDVLFDKLYGENFSFLNSQQPASVMLAEGSAIAVLPMSKINSCLRANDIG